uniref:THAP4-like heme-binding domain-containing protein n=1 Tax=Buteo japonicus TaxID=224669 RepID=A0A8B9YZ26_9AVES
MNPVMEPLSWMLGTWLSDPPGDHTFPTTKPFQYLEEVHISDVGQPIHGDFSFNPPETSKAMHQKCRFIHLKPDTSKVATTRGSASSTGTNNIMSKAPHFQDWLHAFAQSIWLSSSLVTVNQNITRGRHESPLLK